MPTKRLTAVLVEKTRPPETGRLEIWDTVVPSLVLRITPTGARSYAILTRLHGVRTRVTLGSHPALTLEKAREKAREALESAGMGVDPRRNAPARSATDVAAIVDQFVAQYVRPRTRASTAGDYESALRRHVVPVWGKRDITEIRRIDVVALVDGVARAGTPYAANRLLAVVRKMFRWLVQRGVIETSPASEVPAPGAERQRDRVLTDAELALVWRGSEALSPTFRDFVRLLILTAQRRESVAAMRWADVDLDSALWTIPAVAMKADKAHVVPLAPTVVAILAERMEEGAEFVLSTNGTTSISGYSKAKTALDKAIAKLSPRPIAPWRFHDLRRSSATGMSRLGVDRLTIAKVLAHADGSVTGIYDRHDRLEERRAALVLWAEHVESVVAKTETHYGELEATDVSE